MAGRGAAPAAVAPPSTTNAATTNTTSTASTTETRIFEAVAVRWTPATESAVNATTAAAATRFACDGQRYRPTVSAMAAQEAVLPTTKPQPARKPGSGPSNSRP